MRYEEEVNLFTDIFVKKEQVVFISTPTEKKNSWIYLYENYPLHTEHFRSNNSIFVGVDCS